MTKISLIKPLDQPPGVRRLLEDLKTCLDDPIYNDFRLIVAYAKTGPLLRLEDRLRYWRRKGKKAEAILGIDQKGTSKEALALALSLFDKVYVTQEFGITFHPKIYIFRGDGSAIAFIGSNNLTVGGTEKNFEAAVELKLSLPADSSDLHALDSAWNDLLPASCPATTLLDSLLLSQLIADGTVIDEKSMSTKGGADDSASVGRSTSAKKSGLTVKPESPLPKTKVTRPKSTAPKSSAKGAATTASTVAPASARPPVRGLALQIAPHHNGEIFLSVMAARQNPSFFGLPFTGQTKPKKTSNKSYPQRVPDPIVNITVYGASRTPVLIRDSYPLNTVFYDRKKDIRITASPLVSVVPEYSVMIIEPSSDPKLDYEITVHRPDSPDYHPWVSACNQTMPSGGGKTPRKFGWF